MSYTDEYMSGYRIGDSERIALATANSSLRHEVDKLNVEIERLRVALALAVGELSTHTQYAIYSPDQLMQQFLEQARRG